MFSSETIGQQLDLRMHCLLHMPLTGSCGMCNKHYIELYKSSHQHVPLAVHEQNQANN